MPKATRLKNPKIIVVFIRQSLQQHWLGTFKKTNQHDRKLKKSKLVFRLNKIRSSATSQDSGTGAIAKSSGDDFDTSRRGSSGDEGERLRRKRIQIHSLKEIPSTGDNSYNSPDVQFILEVKRSNARVKYDF